MVSSELFFRRLCILLFALVCNCISAQKLPQELMSYKQNGVTKIIESHRRSKIISEYENSFLEKKTSYHRRQVWSISNYRYEITDSVWTIHYSNTVQKDTTTQYVYFTDSVCRATKYNNHIREVIPVCDQLVSISPDTKTYKTRYSCHGDTIVKEAFSDGELSSVEKTVYINGSIAFSSDEIFNDPLAVIADVVPWSKTRQNKCVILYRRFDKYGNWTRSYYLTEKGRVLRSRRKIFYCQ